MRHMQHNYHISVCTHTHIQYARVLFSYHLEPIRSSGHIAQLPRPIGNGMHIVDVCSELERGTEAERSTLIELEKTFLSFVVVVIVS